MGPAPDTLDRRLLNALLDDGRASLREISRQVGVSPTTVSKRVSDLEDRGVIEGYVPVLDYAELGYEAAAVFRLRVASDAHHAVCERLAELPQMTAVYEVTGDFDLVAIGRFPDRDALGERVTELRESPDVERTSTSVVLRAPVDGRQFQLPLE
jgi:DNA-binding Lrp family transcriptional regulator